MSGLTWPSRGRQVVSRVYYDGNSTRFFNQLQLLLHFFVFCSRLRYWGSGAKPNGKTVGQSDDSCHWLLRQRMLLDGRTALEPTPRAQGRRPENRAKVNQKEMWPNVVALRSDRLPAGGCRCVLVPWLLALGFGCFLFPCFSFRVTSQGRISSRL